METAVKSAKGAYEKWKNTSVLTRQTLMLKYQTLIREHSVSLFVFQLYFVGANKWVGQDPIIYYKSEFNAFR